MPNNQIGSSRTNTGCVYERPFEVSWSVHTGIHPHPCNFSEIRKHATSQLLNTEIIINFDKFIKLDLRRASRTLIIGTERQTEL